MASDDSGVTQHLAPDDAVAGLGNEVRRHVLVSLGQAGVSPSSSELRDRVGIRGSTSPSPG